MQTRVRFQMVIARKRFIANYALVRLLAGMRSLMVHQNVFVVETLAAQLAFELSRYLRFDGRRLRACPCDNIVPDDSVGTCRHRTRIVLIHVNRVVVITAGRVLVRGRRR